MARHPRHPAEPLRAAAVNPKVQTLPGHEFPVKQLFLTVSVL